MSVVVIMMMKTMMGSFRSSSCLVAILMALLLLSDRARSFVPAVIAPRFTTATTTAYGFVYMPTTSSTTTTTFLLASSSSSSSAAASPALENLEMLKADLVRTCQQQQQQQQQSSNNNNKPSRDEIRALVQDLEALAEQVGVGQASSLTGLLAGEWELLYAPEDATRSSPFFWAFSKAFPEQADQIFAITDGIPAPLKEIGPAYQVVDLAEGATTGKFVSRVKVASLGGLATSIMTTRGTIVGLDGVDGLRIRIETTKPEDSTLVQTLLPGPLGQAVNERLPPFPSGEALERVQPGSSEVVLRTTFCDEGLRISRNGERLNDIYVWKRRKFASYDFV